VSRPVVHAAAEQVYRLLPDFIRASDEGADYTALRYVAGAAVPLERAADFLTIVDPDTSVTGTCELVNAAACPRPYLGWLGWLVGLNTATVPAAHVRDVVGSAAETQRRGSAGSIRAVVGRTLSHTNPPARVWANLGGDQPYVVSIVTNVDQTPDPSATLQAAVREKPAGMLIELQVVDGAVLVEVEQSFATLADIEDHFATLSAVEEWIP
jgi:phage tail P2-like protein